MWVMKIVNVIPLAKGIFKEQLSYFTSKEALPGSIVSVPVRGRKINALVVSSEDVSEVKAAIKASPYAIKKVDFLSAKNFFLPGFIEAADEAAKYFVATTGDIIRSFTPQAALTESAKLKGIISVQSPIEPAKIVRLKKENFVLQLPDEERLSTYKSLIREEFAKQSSVFFCLPTIEDIEIVLQSLERGIKEYTFALHSGLSKKEMLSLWNKITAEKHPVLIVATATFLSIPRADISTIILDKENSRSYKTFSRPFIDIRTFAEFLAEKLGVRLILGDILLRPETLWRQEQGEFQELAPLKFRSISTATQVIVDMREYKKDTLHGAFKALSAELRELIETVKRKNSNLFILAGRRGLSPITVCSDCGAIFTCARCSSPMVLHKNTEDRKNVFICHKCSSVISAETRCKTCQSWRLTALGIGIEKVHEELLKDFPETKIFRIDKDTTKNSKRAIEIRDQFYTSPGSILLGTGMALHYLNRKVDASAIVGIDSLFAIPDFRINEKIMNFLLILREKTLKHFLIQTRNPDKKLFEYLTRGNLLDFYREEISERKTFGYPPFQMLIKITWSGKKALAKEEMEKLSKILSDYEHITYPAFIQEVKGLYRMNTLIKLDRDKWVDKNLLEILRSIPPYFAIRIDPEDIL